MIVTQPRTINTPEGVTPVYLECHRLICQLIKTNPEGLPLPVEWTLCTKCQAQAREGIIPYPIDAQFTLANELSTQYNLYELIGVDLDTPYSLNELIGIELSLLYNIEELTQ